MTFSSLSSLNVDPRVIEAARSVLDVNFAFVANSKSHWGRSLVPRLPWSAVSGSVRRRFNALFRIDLDAVDPRG